MPKHNSENEINSIADVHEVLDPTQLLRDLIKSRLTNTEIIEELETPLPLKDHNENGE